MTNNISLLKKFLAVSVAANLLFVAMLIASWGAASDEERSASVAMSGEKLDVNVKAEAVAAPVVRVLTQQERDDLLASEVAQALVQSGYGTQNPDLWRFAEDQSYWHGGSRHAKFTLNVECLPRIVNLQGSSFLGCLIDDYRQTELLLAFPSGRTSAIDARRSRQMRNWWEKFAAGTSTANLFAAVSYSAYHPGGIHYLNIDAMLDPTGRVVRLIGAGPSIRLPTRCGSELGSVPEGLGSDDWAKFACVSPEEAESREQCFARADYADEAGRGCPGRSLCCSPKPKEEGL